MTYPEAVRFLYRLVNHERTLNYKYENAFKLDRVHYMLRALGDPHKSFPSVHVAGTKGKGSTAAMVASVLGRAGYKVGLYTSPHLVSFKERIRTDGRKISEEEFSRLIAEVSPLVTFSPEGRSSHSFFDVLTAVAFLHFRREGVDWAVVEVGMGGRLDATNVLSPEICILTPISYDHMKFLGSTLSEIAYEKAGVLKPDVPAVVAPQDGEAMEVIREVASERGVPLVDVGREYRWERTAMRDDGEEFLIEGPWGKYEVFVPLLGEHQGLNAAVAVAAVDLLRSRGLEVPREAVPEGLSSLRLLGRISVVGREPWVVVDVAHNAASAERLRKVLEERFLGSGRLFLVFALLRDKDLPRMAEVLGPVAYRAFLPRLDTPRAMPPEEVKDVLSGYVPCEVYDSVHDAISEAFKGAGRRDVVAVVGSFMLAEQAIYYFGLDVP